ncbi:hypothetical protein [Kitasatospora kifunensis]|uniref:Uncharacterized protein n=1 Tax=Kitasatospora kifunensis TaxID=58351 RepID=A0A7W7R7H0_KITKI|nr:hypothetical protein [Kitasatospora kifunensis]MBB4926724.1 hypothetical protein [Kitasatospora kifunensis]
MCTFTLPRTPQPPSRPEPPDWSAARDTALQLRAAVDLDIHVGPGEHLAFALTRHQAEDLLHTLAAHLGHRVLGVRR